MISSSSQERFRFVHFPGARKETLPNFRVGTAGVNWHELHVDDINGQGYFCIIVYSKCVARRLRHFGDHDEQEAAAILFLSALRVHRDAWRLHTLAPVADASVRSLAGLRALLPGGHNRADHRRRCV